MINHNTKRQSNVTLVPPDFHFLIGYKCPVHDIIIVIHLPVLLTVQSTVKHSGKAILVLVASTLRDTVDKTDI